MSCDDICDTCDTANYAYREELQYLFTNNNSPCIQKGSLRTHCLHLHYVNTIIKSNALEMYKTLDYNSL